MDELRMVGVGIGLVGGACLVVGALWNPVDNLSASGQVGMLVVGVVLMGFGYLCGRGR